MDSAFHNHRLAYFQNAFVAGSSMSEDLVKIMIGLLALAPTIFAFYAAREAKKAVEISKANSEAVAQNSEHVTELKRLIESINHHVNGKMDNLLKVSIEMATLKGAAQERESRDKKDAEAAQAILIAKADEIQEVKVVNTQTEPVNER